MSARILFPAFLLLFHLLPTFGQTPNLSIVLDTSLSDIRVGQFFAVTGRIQLTNGNPVPSGQTIVATVELFAPDGIRVGNPHIQTWNGYDPRVNDGTLSNDGNNDRVLFQIPWSQAQKPLSGWRVQARVEGAGLETDLSDNVVATDPFNMILPDLIISTLNLTTDNRDNLFLSNGTITANGVVRNDGDARTQESILFPLVARLFRFDGSEPIGPTLDSETIIIPSPEAGGFPYIDERDNLRFTIPNLQIPEDALPGEAFVVTVTVDPSDLRFGDIIHETQDNAPDSPNNGNDQTFHINFTVSQTATANIQINANSFEGDTGSFRGLDPIRIAFSIRNSGLMPIQPNEDFTARVALSKDLIFHDENSPSPDFILREFDLGGNALGTNLLPNESVTLDWIQQLPDNLEGDFYYLVNVEETGQTFNLDNTPSISLTSNFRGSTDLVEGSNNNNQSGGERPSSSKDGRIVAYEKNVNSIQQIYYRDLVAGGEPILVSNNYLPFSFTGGNGNSFKPKVSSDGSSIVFHSSASDLVPGDFNEQIDVFLFRIETQEIVRAYDFSLGEEADGSSYNPDVSGDGTVVVFESLATNLQTLGGITQGRQVFVWKTKGADKGLIYAITAGNGESKTPSIDNLGNAIVYMSEATNIPVADLFGHSSTDSNGKADIFLHFLDTNLTYLANLNNFKDQTNTQGFSDQPMISGDGATIVYRSTATNLVQEKGISFIEVENGGVGYNGNPTLLVTDLNLTGSGAILDFQVNGIDSYGQIMANAIRILDHGENYTNPIITVIPDPNFEIPAETAKIKAHLTHPEGEIYMISVADILNLSASNERKYSVRVSENIDQVGGNSESREPSVSDDGSTIVFSTKSSNFLDSNITRSDGEVFYNSPITAAEAKAILVGGIGEIEVDNPGSGYQNGFLFINDISGNGSGASASYQVDALGRISSVKIVDPGSGYNLETTFVSVDNPRGGTGFLGSATTFFEGGRVHRVEMLEHGSGYQNVASTNSGKQGLITIDGDGSDQNGNGKPTAKINSERVKINPQGGGIYIEQIVDVELLSKNSLLNSSITFSDYQKTVTFSFAQANTSATTIGIFGKTLGEITSEIIDAIENQWSPNPTDLFQGPSIPSIISGSTGFSFHGLSGKVETDNPTAFNITYQTNMLIGGSGFTRANPIIAPSPVIHGYSEVVSGTNVVNVTNGRGLYMPVVDHETDDIYLYTVSDKSLERVSKSTFGLPINYLASSTSTMPSNRFPSISGDGRHIFFSSDASGRGGLAFSNTNQSASDNNTVRDIYHHDRKTTAIVSENLFIEMIFPNKDITHGFAPQSNLPVIIDLNYSGSDLNFVALFVDEQFTGFLLPAESSYVNQRWFTPSLGSFNVGDPGVHVLRAIAFNDNVEEIGASLPVQYLVTPLQGRNPNIDFNGTLFDVITTTSSLTVSSSATDSDGTIEGVQFYVDGEKYGDEILRTPGIPQASQSYTTELNFSTTGVKSIIAVAHDNSGNYVASMVNNLSIAPGSNPSVIQFGSGISDLTLSDSDLDINISASGSLLNVNLANPVGNNFVGTPRVDILGNGSNAEVTAVVNQSVGSQNYGKITGFEVKNGGIGYDINSTNFKVVPVVRLIGNGTPAEITAPRITDTNETTGEPIFVSQSVRLDTNVDGTFKGGSGYVISPRMSFSRAGVLFQDGQSFERLPLAEPIGTTSSVAEFNIGPYGAPLGQSSLIGGFSHSPVSLSFNVFQTIEQIAEVVLLIDGIPFERKSSPPYSFEWVPDDSKDYSISAVVKDVVGNVSSTPTQTIAVKKFEGSGVSASFNVPIPESANVGTDLLLSVEAFSEVGVAEVEFFIDGVSVGKVLDQNSSVFSKVINLYGYDQGLHQVSFIARDYNGNQAGVFDRSLTNIATRQRQPLNINPAANVGVPTITMNYPNNNITISSTSTIRLTSLATDPDDSLVGVQYYLNGKYYGELIPYDKSKPSDQHAFGINWTPNGETGTFYFSASASDSNGNVTFTPPVAVQVSQGNEYIPVVSLGSLSSSYDVGDVISLTASVLDSAVSSSGYGIVEQVRFFVNGRQQGGVDTQFPYVRNWNPPDAGTYDVHVLARDNEGNIGISEVKEVKILDLERVNLYMAPVEQLNDGTGIGLIDGSLHRINVSATGDPEALSNLNALTLYANGKVVGRSTGTQLILGTGLIDRVAYSFEWLVDYKRYADANGGVQLVATGGNPLISTNIQSVRILSPVPWSNPVSAAGSILKDLTGVGASESDIQEFQHLMGSSESNPNGALLNWLETVNSSTVEQRIDIVAAHHISIGKFHSSLSSILEAETFIAVNNDQWLKSYIDELLMSNEYQAKFGQVPFMVGSMSQSNSINFNHNRMQFVRQVLLNKYSFEASFAEVYQGAHRMLSYWENFEPGYWELQIGSNDGSIDSPPRRDALPFQIGLNDLDPNNLNNLTGLVLDQNYNYNGPEAGHCAVDLIYNLSRENVYEGCLPYITGTKSLRQNQYKIVVYIFFLMRENASSLSNEELNTLISLPFEQAFEKIINDYRYTSRFNLIWNTSTEVALNWKQEPWFGLFMDKYFPWIYHVNLGWVYISGGTQEYDKQLNVGGFWAFSQNLGWFWTYNEAFPWIYLENEWVYLKTDSSSTMSDLYFSTAQNNWIRF